MNVTEKYEKLTKLFISKKMSITTMESCTSGLIASLLTDTEGASAIMKGAYITYSNEAKVKAGVPEEVIKKYGVYSVETAAEMAKKCKDSFVADIGIGVTGSFGNVDPNNADSVPGEIHFAIAFESEVVTASKSIPVQPSRYEYKLYAADLVADKLLSILKEKGITN